MQMGIAKPYYYPVWLPITQEWPEEIPTERWLTVFTFLAEFGGINEQWCVSYCKHLSIWSLLYQQLPVSTTLYNTMLTSQMSIRMFGGGDVDKKSGLRILNTHAQHYMITGSSLTTHFTQQGFWYSQKHDISPKKEMYFYLYS